LIIIQIYGICDLIILAVARDFSPVSKLVHNTTTPPPSHVQWVLASLLELKGLGHENNLPHLN
jgi:hypothetical protein